MNISSRSVVLATLTVVTMGVLAAAWFFWPRPLGNGNDGPAVQGLTTVQGITTAERQDFYHLPEGSELYPLAWIQAMHDKNTKQPFLTNIERFGMLPDANDADGLPIGVSRGESRGLSFLGPMIGVNCAACHVGQLTFKGKSFTLIGGPSMISMDQFYGDLFASVGAMVADPAELAAFYGRLSKQKNPPIHKHARVLLSQVANLAGKAATELQPAEHSLTTRFNVLLTKVHNDLHADLDTISSISDDARARLRALYKVEIDELLSAVNHPDLASKFQEVPDPLQLRAGIEELVTNAALMKGRLNFLLRIKSLHGAAATTPGPGRSDAFGIISSMVMPNEVFKLTAPVNYPFIWSLGPPYQTVWFHYDGNTTSLLQRNVGQAVGLGAAYDPKTYSSTIVIRDMDRLQQITRKLRPPEWPAQLFGSIDTTKFDRGAKVFKEHCMSCHADAFEKDVKKRELYFDYQKVGTDPNRIDNFQVRVMKTEQRPDGVPYIEALGGAARSLTDAAYKDWEISPEEQKRIEPVEVKWVSKKAYMARPMVAIWATAPYLHNGSVPTIYDLLQPAAKRPRYFTVGNREYDPEKLGYVTQVVADPKAAVEAPQWVFDTTISGNRNSGHEYGVELTLQEKTDLMEYLKGNYVTRYP